MDLDLTFASFMEPAGVIAAAAVVTSLIALLRAVFPRLVEYISGAILAFLFTGVLYVLTAFAIGITSLDAGLGVFLAWLSCATSAVGIHSTVAHARIESGVASG